MLHCLTTAQNPSCDDFHTSYLTFPSFHLDFWRLNELPICKQPIFIADAVTVDGKCATRLFATRFGIEWTQHFANSKITKCNNIWFFLSWKSLSHSASARGKQNFLSVVKLTQGQVFRLTLALPQHMFLFIDTKQLFMNELEAQLLRSMRRGRSFSFERFCLQSMVDLFRMQTHMPPPESGNL